MSIFSRLFERRSTTAIQASDPYLAEFFGGRSYGNSGFVDVAKASGLSVAHACIQLIATNLAAVPLNLYRRAADGGREHATEHPLYDVLHSTPSDNLTAFEAREYLITSLLIRGNAYARIEWNGRGQVKALHPLDPQSTSVEMLESGRLRYRHTNQRGQSVILTQNEVLHLRYRLASDGAMGISPITLACDAFALSLTQQTQAQSQATKNFRPEGVLSYPNPIGTDGKDGAFDKLEAKANDTTQKGGILVLDGGAKWSPLNFSSKDAEFLESRKMSDLAVARIYAVPPSTVGITDNMTYSNAGDEARALVSRCLAPMARRVEQAMNAALLPTSARRNHFIEHDMAGLLRGDLQSRYEAYGLARQNGFMSANDIRQLENMGRIEGGDTYLEPLNMKDAADAATLE